MKDFVTKEEFEIIANALNRLCHAVTVEVRREKLTVLTDRGEIFIPEGASIEHYAPEEPSLDWSDEEWDEWEKTHDIRCNEETYLIKWEAHSLFFWEYGMNFDGPSFEFQFS